MRAFSGNWSGTGAIENSGDSERAALESGEYLESEVVVTGAGRVQLAQNQYSAGDDALLKYRTAATEGDCLSAAWGAYAGQFDSLGYTQVRIEAP